MSEVVIDTNVAVVANRQNNDASVSCADACILFLTEVQSNHVVLIDGADEIRGEYAKNLIQSRPYQLGAQFLLHILQHQGNSAKVRIVELPKTEQGEFEDFPDCPELATFDRSDRKFAALARRTGNAVTNAIDSDWLNALPHLRANGIDVTFLCGADRDAWFAK